MTKTDELIKDTENFKNWANGELNEYKTLVGQLLERLKKYKELRALEQMPEDYLNAYLFYQQAVYSNYDIKHLKISIKDKEDYIARQYLELDKSKNSVKGSRLLEIRDWAEDETLTIEEINDLINVLLAIKKGRLEQAIKESQEPRTKAILKLVEQQESQEKTDELLRKHNFIIKKKISEAEAINNLPTKPELLPEEAEYIKKTILNKEDKSEERYSEILTYVSNRAVIEFWGQQGTKKEQAWIYLFLPKELTEKNNHFYYDYIEYSEGENITQEIKEKYKIITDKIFNDY